MKKTKSTTIEVQGTAITIMSREKGDYISLTDMVRHFEGGGALIEQWLKNKDTVLFLGVWDKPTGSCVFPLSGFNKLETKGVE